MCWHWSFINSDTRRPQSSNNKITTWVFDDELIIGTAIGGLSNPEIRWEKQYTFDVGLDAKFFDNKLDVSLDYFNRRTEDLLITPQTSGILGGNAPGSGAPTVNAGDKGNTVLIIEHNLDVIKTVDYIIDIGPEGGKSGGKVMATGTPEEIVKTNKGFTAKFLKKELQNK